jgi:membrane protease YdiL (CAAX protease family)
MTSASSGDSAAGPPPAVAGPGAVPAVGRSSAIDPQIKLERRVSPWFGFMFYGFLFAVGAVWMYGYSGRPFDPWMSTHLLRDVAVGLGAGAALVLVTPVLVGRVKSLRALEREFGWMLGEQRAWECLYLALLSGAAEEYFFRGAMLAAWGPWLSLAAFAALHWPVRAEFRAWPITAALVGAVLTAQALWTGSVLAPAITHALINAVNLLRITRRYRTWIE